MSKYIIKEGQGEDPREVVKIDTTININLNTVANELAHFNKSITELEAQAKIEEAVMQNVVDFHPHVLDYSDEQLNEIMMYGQAKTKAKLCREKLGECQTTLEELNKMSKDIEEQTGLKA